MMMLFVIPAEEVPAKCSGVLYRSESVRELREVFERFELCFRIRVVITNVWSAMGFGYTQIRQQMRNKF